MHLETFLKSFSTIASTRIYHQQNAEQAAIKSGFSKEQFHSGNRSKYVVYWKDPVAVIREEVESVLHTDLVSRTSSSSIKDHSWQM